MTHTWIIAVWTPSFTNFLHKCLEENPDTQQSLDRKELYIGDVFRETMKEGLKSAYVEYDEGVFIDIGTPEDLAKVNSLEWLD